MKLSLSGIWKDRLTTIIGLLFVADVVRRYTTGEVSLSELALNIDLAVDAGEALFGAVMMLIHRKDKPKTTQMDYTGFRFLAEDNTIVGYKFDWEYPSQWVQDPNANTTEELAELNPTMFEAITTPFPNPQVPRPKK